MNNWIKLEEQAPPSLKKILVYGPRLGMFIVRPSQEDTLEYVGYDNDGGAFRERITHWMPMPKPPMDGVIKPKKSRCNKYIYENCCTCDKDNVRNCLNYKRNVPNGGYDG